MLSVYDQLIQEGRMQGLSQGLHLAYTNIATNLRKKGYTKGQIIENLITFFELSKKEATAVVSEVMGKQV